MLRHTHIKRLIDFVCAAVLLCVLSPLLVVLSIAIAFALGRPVFFRQRRPGLNGKPFTLIKFRTMRDAVDATGAPLSDAERMTRFGALLRATSLDELPELLNVLRGEMSLVGPRPLLMEYLPRYSESQARRHEVRPGITGWAQIHGRNALSWDNRFELDVWYVDHWTYTLDAQILMRTITRVIARDGISEPGHVTAAPFTGSVSSTRSAACSH